MKWIIYILLLVNLGLFVWHYQPGGGKRQSLAHEQHTRLVLRQEYEQQLRLAREEDGVSRCFSLGPFTHKESFNKAKQRLSQEGIEVFSRVSSDSVRDGYWVMLPVAASRNQAVLQIQKLKQSGVKDYFLVAAGEMKNAVSLGVFSKPTLAKHRLDELEKLGFRAKIKKIALPNRVYWLEWPRHAVHQPSQALLDALRAEIEGIGQSERTCLAGENR